MHEARTRVSRVVHGNAVRERRTPLPHTAPPVLGYYGRPVCFLVLFFLFLLVCLVCVFLWLLFVFVVLFTVVTCVAAAELDDELELLELLLWP
jgi:hypothetical protein